MILRLCRRSTQAVVALVSASTPAPAQLGTIRNYWRLQKPKPAAGTRRVGGSHHYYDPTWNARIMRISKRLKFLLSEEGCKDFNLKMEPDGYVCVADLLTPQIMPDVDLMDIQQIVSEVGQGTFFSLRYAAAVPGSAISQISPPTTRLRDWWIRPTKSSTIQHVSTDLQRIFTSTAVPLAAVGVTEKEWETVSVVGLVRRDDEPYITFGCSIAGGNQVIGEKTSKPIIVYLDVPRALSRGLRFYYNNIGQLVTSGDRADTVPPDLFSRVERVQVLVEPIIGPWVASPPQYPPRPPTSFKKKRPLGRNPLPNVPNRQGFFNKLQIQKANVARLTERRNELLKYGHRTRWPLPREVFNEVYEEDEELKKKYKGD